MLNLRSHGLDSGKRMLKQRCIPYAADKKIPLRLLLSVAFLISFPSMAADLYMQRVRALFSEQALEESKPYWSALPLLKLNGRELRTSSDDFGKIIKNTFKQCDEIDTYNNRKGGSTACKEEVLEGITDWLAVSRDPKISSDAWNAGASQSVLGGTDPRAAVIMFRHWAGTARVVQQRISSRK